MQLGTALLVPAPERPGTPCMPRLPSLARANQSAESRSTPLQKVMASMPSPSGQEELFSCPRLNGAGSLWLGRLLLLREQLDIDACGNEGRWAPGQGSPGVHHGARARRLLQGGILVALIMRCLSAWGVMHNITYFGGKNVARHVGCPTHQSAVGADQRLGVSDPRAARLTADSFTAPSACMQAPAPMRAVQDHRM